MEQMGILRRIDELGRIVIPKGIRNRLKINEGDSLEMLVSNQNQIIIAKYNSFQGNDETIVAIVNSLGRELNLQLAVCSSELFIAQYPLKEDNIVQQLISPTLLHAIDERKVVPVISQNLVNGRTPLNYMVFPLVKNSESLGALVVLERTSLSDEETRVLNCFRNVLISVLKI